MLNCSFGSCVHGRDALSCSHQECVQSAQARANLLHMSTVKTRDTQKLMQAKTRRFKCPKRQLKAQRRRRFCSHFPEGATNCKQCKVNAKEELLRIMLEQNNETHLCPFLYEN